MNLVLEIPQDVAEAMKLPPGERADRIRTEFALALYAQDILSLGKAAGLAGLERRDFGRLLGQRRIPRHYGPDDLENDLQFARGQ